MKITFRQASLDDVIRQYRYYLVTLDLPEIAVRFKEAVKHTSKVIRQQPLAGPVYGLRNPQLQNLRSWPITGFESVRMYFLVDECGIRVIRILHGKRNIRRILEKEDSVF